jgi:hypothetical protein
VGLITSTKNAFIVFVMFGAFTVRCNMQFEQDAADILKRLNAVPMTLALLKATKVGAVVNRAKKQFPITSTAGELATTLVALWKKVAAEAEKEARTPPPADASAERSNKSSSSSSVSLSSSATTAASDQNTDNTDEDNNHHSPKTGHNGAVESSSPRGGSSDKADEEVEAAISNLPSNRKNVRGCCLYLFDDLSW